MATEQRSFVNLPSLSIAEGASSPNPGSAGIWAWSSSLSRPVYWNGSIWTSVPTSGGGSDPWTILRLSSDFTTTSATAVNVTGLSFTPSASTRYLIYGIFLVRTATATVGPRPGVAWPTGMTDGVVTLYTTSSVSAQVMQNGNINAAVLGPVGGLPNTTQSYPSRIEGYLLAGASPSGTFKIQLASETAGTTVRMVTGSFIKYRTIT